MTTYDEKYAAGGYDYIPEREREALPRLVVEPAGWRRGAAILEIGCGIGLHAHLLHDAGFRVTAVDLSEVGIAEAKARYPGPSFVACDLAAYEPGASFGGIYCRGMSWYHYELDEGLRERTRRILGWLDPGGTFVLQIATDFSGAQPAGLAHNNRLDDYLRLFQPLGEIVNVSDWRGRPLPLPEGTEPPARGVVVVVRP